MGDNARPHRARVVTDYLEREGIARMDWPARSTDINPIEHVWDILQRRISERLVQPQTRRTLHKHSLRNALEFLVLLSES